MRKCTNGSTKKADEADSLLPYERGKTAGESGSLAVKVKKTDRFAVKLWKGMAALIWSTGVIAGLLVLQGKSLAGLGVIICSGILGAVCISVAEIFQDVADTAAALQSLAAAQTENNEEN